MPTTHYLDLIPMRGGRIVNSWLDQPLDQVRRLPVLVDWSALDLTATGSTGASTAKGC